MHRCFDVLLTLVGTSTTRRWEKQRPFRSPRPTTSVRVGFSLYASSRSHVDVTFVSVPKTDRGRARTPAQETRRRDMISFFPTSPEGWPQLSHIYVVVLSDERGAARLLTFLGSKFVSWGFKFGASRFEQDPISTLNHRPLAQLFPIYRLAVCHGGL
jgi:hypothetical protein